MAVDLQIQGDAVVVDGRLIGVLYANLIAKRTSRSWLGNGSRPTTLMFTGSRLGNSAQALSDNNSNDRMTAWTRRINGLSTKKG